MDSKVVMWQTTPLHRGRRTLSLGSKAGREFSSWSRQSVVDRGDVGAEGSSVPLKGDVIGR